MRKWIGTVSGIALATLPLAGAAQTTAEARAFVAGLYAAYQRGEPDYLGRRAGAVFAPRLLALIRKDQAATPKGDAPALDWDPICGCQDAEGLKAVSVETAKARPGAISARARISSGGEARTVELDLVSVGGRWRVEDVRTPETPSLVRLLSKAR